MNEYASVKTEKVGAPMAFQFKAETGLVKGEISANRLRLTLSDASKGKEIKIDVSKPIVSAFPSVNGLSIICMYGDNMPADFFCTKTGKALSPSIFSKKQIT